SAPWPTSGKQAGEGRTDAGEEVGDSRQVAHQVVAVQPEEGKELLRDRKMLQGDEHDEPMEPRYGVETPHREHEDDVEIHTAKVRSQAPAPAQPVGVGEVTE